ncbi:MAG: DNA-directed RNA polymerase subunit beta [Planctomycetota bacterium]|nr:MAG: DNA-directed RNA polymerase subunit beta [Planctomycetota bacterium]
MNIRHFGKFRSPLAVPSLTDIQNRSFEDFLMVDVPFNRRTEAGLEAILRETFPIYSYDKTVSLEYLGYELGRPRYTADECRILGVTYGMPFKVLVRLEKPEPVEEWVYLGEIPIMVGGGEFIINGSERVIVSQLHRSPGVDFSMELHTNEKKLHSCWVIPQRGSWVELSVTKKDVMDIKIDQTSKFPATTFLRAMAEEYGTNEQILPLFYKTKKVSLKSSKDKDLLGKHVVGDVIDESTGEIILKSCAAITAESLEMILGSALKSIELITNADDDALMLYTLAEDEARSHEEALLKIYTRLRPGNPPNIEKARTLFRERFQDPTRYRLGPVGRFRINRKFGRKTGMDVMTLSAEDVVDSMRYIMDLRANRGQVDDIDHLGNRRVRTIAELAGDEFRKGFLKLRRTASERMNNQETIQTATPRQLINSKTISSSIEYFFGRGELSQVVDQSNPLSQLTHERRLSALGPGGLNRKRAGFDVRDVHISHYGRICPIETPEGSNIGLIASLSIYAMLDDFGFLVTPYRKVTKGKVSDKVTYLRADEEYDSVLAPADTDIDDKGHIVNSIVLSRVGGEFSEVDVAEVQYVDVSPMQLVGVSAALIPFLEHDDANRALMGSNMQRQAVPLVIPEPPVVATGMERDVATNSGMVVRAKRAGTVNYVDAESIVIGDDTYELRKFVGLNEKTCLNQKPAVVPGQKVKAGDLLADGASTKEGELALGRNILVGFMIWDGYNFEDAIIVSESLIRKDIFTSIHIQHYDVEIRETKLGREEFTRDIPNVSEGALGRLDEDGIVLIGSKVQPGDILVGKVSPKSKSELTPEEKLLHAIFGRAGEDVKNDSLEVSPGVYGTVISTLRFTRNVDTSEEQSAKNLRMIRAAERQFRDYLSEQVEKLVAEINEISGTKLKDDTSNKILVVDTDADSQELRRQFELVRKRCMESYRRGTDEKLYLTFRSYAGRIEEQENEKNKVVNRLSRGDELPTGVLEMVKVYIATKRTLSVGDKMAGRHGNKGVISVVLPEEDMPFLEDGTPLQILLNPLGVPSRMNVGQILETHLGWAAMNLGFQAVTPVFDGASEEAIFGALEEAGLPVNGMATLFDGRTGRPFDQKVTVGYLYMLKLHHLVADKVHARATGPYSLITQQPLGGKARFGGQRFGEMEVWALEAYGAASILQELLTVKSDDVEGRTRIYESMVKGTNVLEPGTPISFDVLTNEIRGLCLNMELHRGNQ